MPESRVQDVQDVQDVVVKDDSVQDVVVQDDSVQEVCKNRRHPQIFELFCWGAPATQSIASVSHRQTYLC